MIIRMFVYHPMRDEVTTYVVDSSRQVCMFVQSNTRRGNNECC